MCALNFDQQASGTGYFWLIFNSCHRVLMAVVVFSNKSAHSFLGVILSFFGSSQTGHKF